MSATNLIQKAKSLERNKYLLYSLARVHQSAFKKMSKSMVYGLLLRYPLKEIVREMMISDKVQSELERILLDTNVNLGLLRYLSKLFSKSDWKILDNNLQQHRDAYLQQINEKVSNAEDREKLVLKGAKLLIEYLTPSKGSLEKVFSSNLKQYEELCSRFIENVGKVICRTLYIKLCSYIIIGPQSNLDDARIKEADQLCEKYRKEIYNSLRSKDFKRVTYLGNELYLVAEIAALWHASKISYHQTLRSGNIGEDVRIKSLHDELEETKLMKDRIRDYATGLYFYSSPPNLPREAKYSSKLEYQTKDETPALVPAQKILKNPNAYLGKTLKVRGVVASVTEKKWKIRGKEAVKIEFDIKDNQHQISAFHHGHLLRDNGLEKDGLVEVTGVFVRDGNKYRIKISSYSFYKTKNKDWVNRCKWIVGKWWDAGSDNTICDWTLSQLHPSEPLKPVLVFITAPKKEDLMPLIKEVKQNPSVRAAISASKKIFSVVDNEKFEHKLRITQFKSLAIDELIFVISSSERR